MLRHLIGAANAIRADFGAEIESRGHDLSPSTAHLLVNLPVDGIGMSELTERLQVSQQRTGQLVQMLEDFGYVERVADPEDGRAKRVVFTARGRRLLADIEKVDALVTKGLAELLGEKRFARLCKDIEALDSAIRGEDDVIAFEGPGS
jgi:DNA-binding MarR family transcriptional regulator